MALNRSYDLYCEGRRLLEAGHLVAALETLERSNVENPHFKTLELIGECRMALGDLAGAVGPLEEAAKLNRGLRAPCLLATVLLALGETERAMATAESVMSRDPNNRKARAILEATTDQPSGAQAERSA